VWEGVGIISFDDGAEYRGFIKNQVFNGKGRLRHQNGDVYQGEWKDGKAHGRGVFIQSQIKQLYEGEWREDEMHGQGVEVWEGGKMRYSGDFRFGKKTGQGVFEFEGHRYEGEFLDGQFHGLGKYTNPDKKRVLEGRFEENEMVEGRMFFEDGSYYEGELLKDEMHGKGVIYLASGLVFVGSFKHDKKHGTCMLYDLQNSSKQQEDWANGTRTNFIKTLATQDEIQRHIRNPTFFNSRSPSKVVSKQVSPQGSAKPAQRVLAAVGASRKMKMVVQ
jgi:hypothetical protein